MLQNLHSQHQQPSFNYLQAAVASTHATNHAVVKIEAPSTHPTNHGVVKLEASDRRIASGFTPLSSNNGSSSQAHTSSTYSLTSKQYSSIAVPSPIVPFTNPSSTTSPASKRPCFSPPEESSSREIQVKRGSPNNESSSSRSNQPSTSGK
ncbi:hypothetical protein OSTOST_08640 [Ostertagia ostertagi]